MGSTVTINTSAPVFPTASISRKKWVEEQSNNLKTGRIKELWKLKKLKLALLQKQKHTYCMRKGLFYQEVRHCNRDECTFQFVLPSKYRKKALKGCHNDTEYLGIERCQDI